MKERLLGKTLSELEEIVISLGLKKFVAKQIADWLYKKNISNIIEMRNLAKNTRELLSEKYEFGLTAHQSVQVSIDGTKKYLFPAGKNQYIESAYIPDERLEGKSRATLCVSSQVGCKMGCLFCMTAKQGFQAQLSSGEILNQIRSLPEKDKLSNIVYMGMGEPFDNLDNVLRSVEILTADWGFAMSPKRITVSTIGMIPGMIKFLEKSEAHLAVSLHSPFEEERKKLMPIENVYRLPKVLNAIKNMDWSGQRRISFEYIMFKGVNDTEKHIKELLKILNGFKCRINLLKFHPIPDSPLESSDMRTMEWFRDQLKAKGVMTTIRASRGEDIFAACGLLSTKELVKRKTNNDF